MRFCVKRARGGSTECEAVSPWAQRDEIPSHLGGECLSVFNRRFSPHIIESDGNSSPPESSPFPQIQEISDSSLICF